MGGWMKITLPVKTESYYAVFLSLEVFSSVQV